MRFIVWAAAILAVIKLECTTQVNAVSVVEPTTNRFTGTRSDPLSLAEAHSFANVSSYSEADTKADIDSDSDACVYIDSDSDAEEESFA